jgi:hypothetical protein
MKDLGAAKKILGMEIHRDRDAKTLWLSQADYVKKVLERFSMENAKLVSTPLANHFHLSTSQCQTIEETEDMSKVPYAIVMGVFDVCYGMYKARFGSCSEFGEKVYGKFEETALRCS